MLKTIIIIFCFLISSCNSKSHQFLQAHQEILQYKKYHLQVDDIQIIEKYNSPFHRPYLEHLLPITPCLAIKKWIDKSLVSVGEKNILRIVIKEASIIESKISDNKYKYDAKVNITLSLVSEIKDAKITKDNIFINHNLFSSKAQKPLHDKEFFNKLVKLILDDFQDKMDSYIHSSSYNLITK